MRSVLLLSVEIIEWFETLVVSNGLKTTNRSELGVKLVKLVCFGDYHLGDPPCLRPNVWLPGRSEILEN